ncbi:DUF3696 domain-containing protein [Massilia sp. YMA4]|uniref:AAA family ATPase n=1 Tax=Massilia sp. YMA4 TaxID=1593482 RepID=UPI000DD11706|nr:DUF3696 domain-containing protein [Massilia sp. YMA4]AXA94021.1 DUF3696 domain-containing protein [Massilia sp. YMA4]
MLTQIRLYNFKCFKDAVFSLAPFTLLAGLNGMGKSSVIQSLLLLRQSWETGDLTEGRLRLSGELTDLGTGNDILFDGADADVIGIGVTVAVEETNYDVGADFFYQYIREADRLESVWTDGVKESQDHLLSSDVADLTGLFSRKFHYVFAERYGPRKTLPMSETHAREMNIGIRGEYVLHFLLEHGTKIKIAESDPRFMGRVGGDKESLLLSQVDVWLQEISPGSHLTIDAIRRADFALGGFEFDRPNDVRTRSFRATNVGFGLSYVLPVLVALLATRKGSLVLLENPEAHMHPRGQTILGQLAARAAAAGVQVIVETHSDHFMDGARIDIREGILKPDLAAFHFFERSGTEAAISSPTVDSDGRLSDWPMGFFDQHEENLANLLAPKRM